MEGHLYLHPKCVINALDNGLEAFKLFLDSIDKLLPEVQKGVRISASSLKDASDYLSGNHKTVYEEIIDNIHSTVDSGALLHQLNLLEAQIRNNHLSLEQMNKHLEEGNDDDYYFGLIADKNMCADFVEDYKKVYCGYTLYQFHISFLEKLPVSEDSYADRCKDFFLYLEFDEEFRVKLKTFGEGSSALKGITHFSKVATEALTALNEHELTSTVPRDIFIDLQEKSGFPVSEQGESKSEKGLKRKVELPGGLEHPINCEYHFKMPHRNDDNNKDYYSRLYFGIYPIGFGKKFYVYHLGKHL